MIKTRSLTLSVTYRLSVRNVLSIDGCGFRGRTQLLVLNRLMELHSGDPANPSRPCDVFDLICGTAAGGLIAILLGRLEMTCDEAIRAYDFLEYTFFDQSPPSLPQTPPTPRTIPPLPTPLSKPSIKDILNRTKFNGNIFQGWLDRIIQSFAGKDVLMDDGQTRTCRVETTYDCPLREAHPYFTTDPRHCDELVGQD